jgi:hypothetical protein
MQLFDMEVQIGDPVAVGGLSVFPLTGTVVGAPPYLTGPEAFELGLIEVGELDPPEVPFLVVTNRADVPILLVEGEMLIGGDQNRTMNVTVLCPPNAAVTVPVSCVEAGRWGARRVVSGRTRLAPGSLRAAKIVGLEPRSGAASSRRSDQGRVWDEVERQSLAHAVESDTSALDDVQEQIEERIAVELDQVRAVDDQIGVVCTVGYRVVGLDLFDRPSTLDRYLRAIVAGHALDAPESADASDAVRVIRQFLADVAAAPTDIGTGVGLGDELLLAGRVAGVGLSYGQRLVHLAAFPVPA